MFFHPAEGKRAAVSVKNARDVTKVWREVKEREGKYADRTSVLDGLPLGLPALERARRMTRRASRAGFEWSDADGVFIGIEGDTG